MTPYLFVFFISSLCCFFAYLFKKKKSVFIFFSLISIILPSLLSGFRDTSVGIDVDLYGVRVFEQSAYLRSFADVFNYSKDYGVELFYVIINVIVQLFSNNIFWLFFIQQVFALSIVSITCYRMKEKINAPLLFTIYLLYYFCWSMCHLRQMFAVAIALLAFSFLIEKKWKVYIILLLVGFFFHKSILFLLILLPLNLITEREQSVKKRYFFLIFIMGSVMYFFFPMILAAMVASGVMDTKYMLYASQEGNQVHKIDFLITLCLFLFSFIRERYYLKNNIKVLCILIIFVLLCGVYNDVATRIAYYLNFYLFLFILMLSYNGKFKLNKKECIFLCIILIQFLYLGITSGFSRVIPYTSKVLGLIDYW